MAVKKTATKAGGAKKAAAKKSAPKKSATKAGGAKKSAPKKKAPKKKAAPVKLTDNQKALLKKISDTKDTGYVGPKAEGRMLESLQTKKLIKRGAKDKTSGSYRYTVSKAGEKHLSTAAAGPGA
jgi:hypothetical protein